MGLLGLSMLFTLTVIYLSSITSFGVSFFSPIAPHHPSSNDTVYRPIILNRVLRPYNIKPIEKVRGKKIKRRK